MPVKGIDSVTAMPPAGVVIVVAARGASSAATKLARGVQWVGLSVAKKVVASAVALAGVWDNMSDVR
jgi:hypothetical protein